MKSKLLFTFVFLYTTSIFAKEGMWLPFLLQSMNEKEMRQMGMKIKASDIYDVNEGSLKDAVVIFGEGCTGEVISDKGLVLTNHHCGYGAVQGLSSVEHNYLLNGFWAMNNQEELPCPGLSVTFIVRIDDVTEAVKLGVLDNMPDSTKNRIIAENMATIEKASIAQTGYGAQIKSFYADNEYYLFITEKYNDIRLVGFPPNGIGKFGGDADNWAWPRHTGDFGVFRIYANKENKPASFSTNNIPFIPRRSMSVNINGVQEGDFTWVYGFPGRTSEYLTSNGVAEVMNTLDPTRIKIREARLNIMDADMKESETNFIKYAAKQAGIANYYKKWKGELLGLRLNNAIEKKENEEIEFMKWVNEDEARKLKYGTLITDIAQIYETRKESLKLNEYINESIWASEVLKKTTIFNSILKTLDTLKDLSQLELYTKELNNFYKLIDKKTDCKIAVELFQIYRNDIGNNEMVKKEMIHQIYTNSLMVDVAKFGALMQIKDKQKITNAIKKDPAYVLFSYFDKLQKDNLIGLKAYSSTLNKFYGNYIAALKEYKEGQLFYPDANATLRVSYGYVEGVKPQDGIIYNYYTTLDGAVKKHNPEIEEFQMPQKLIELYNAKDYGDYAIEIDGKETVPLAFLASNHTTGGNSGSPVLNDKGELIGTNFDRIWEGTMSDIMYDINLCRNITLDIRYTLFIIEKLGGAKWLIDEMNVVK